MSFLLVLPSRISWVRFPVWGFDSPLDLRLTLFQNRRDKMPIQVWTLTCPITLDSTRSTYELVPKKGQNYLGGTSCVFTFSWHLDHGIRNQLWPKYNFFSPNRDSRYLPLACIRLPINFFEKKILHHQPSYLILPSAIKTLHFLGGELLAYAESSCNFTQWHGNI